MSRLEGGEVSVLSVNDRPQHGPSQLSMVSPRSDEHSSGPEPPSRVSKSSPSATEFFETLLFGPSNTRSASPNAETRRLDSFPPPPRNSSSPASWLPGH